MPEPITWLPDGTPYSPRFQDRYRSENGGLEQARGVFLHGCGLPQAWAGAAQWRILETGFGLGLNFLVAWAAWRADLPEHRPHRLHFVSVEAYPVTACDLLRAAQAHPELLPLATQLHSQFHGLTPGFHRLAFDDGQVLLTLCIGDARALLREQAFYADSVFLDGFSPQQNPGIWDAYTLKAVARCCRRGTRLATWTIARSVRDALAQCGFEVHKMPGVPPKRDNLQALFNPRWEPRRAPDATAPLHTSPPPGRCLVVGAGLAGAAVAHSLARRGWQVQVCEAGAHAAAGASGLLAGVLAPHVSPDDSVLSRLTRAGVRLALEHAQRLLQVGQDWAPTGALERRVDGGGNGLPTHPGSATLDWSQPASPEQLAQAQIPADAAACWHAMAGWVKPAQLVQALLQAPATPGAGGITLHLNTSVAQLERHGDAWRALDAAGHPLMHVEQADIVVVAAGYASRTLLDELPLQALRGQLSWGLQSPANTLPPFPVNGHGSLIAHIPTPEGLTWYAGATYERDCTDPEPNTEARARNQAANLDHLGALLPEAARQLQAQFHAGLQNWSQIRCAAPDRLPLVGPIGPAPGLWACTAMGSRGISLSLLCAELLAARLMGEPLPLEQRLAQALGTERLATKAWATQTAADPAELA